MDYSFFDLLKLIGSLGLFLYGMKIMSEGLQKAAGDRMQSILSSMTNNRFAGVLKGILITALIQSSSATTVMVVSFVNAGLLTLIQAISVIMGANIGTTVTAWLVAWLGFKADISILAVPMMLFGFLFSNSKKNQRQNIGELIVGFSLLFLGLSFMKNSVPDLRETPQVLEFVTTWASHGFGSVLLFLVFGTVLTLVLQSSSATMAITLIMLSMGWIPFHMACAMVLGENIGTTITANIAASVGNTQAKRAAMSHTIFNVFGVIWALILFKPFTALVGKIIELFGLPNPAAEGFAVVDGDMSSSTAALYGLSMLHTLFNTINTLILIWFIKLIEKAVVWIIKPKSQDKEPFRLKYISAGPLATPELSVEQAFDEIIHFAKISRNGLGYAKQAIETTDEKVFEEMYGKLVKYEEISDRIEYEIASFLNSLPQESISEDTRQKVKAMYKIIGELESLGDSGESISRILSRRNIHNKQFTEQHIEKIDTMLSLVDKAYKIMINNLETTENTSDNLRCAVDCEIEINDMRNTIREEEILKIENNDAEYHSSVYYIDIISEIERMGDFIINISEALQRK